MKNWCIIILSIFFEKTWIITLLYYIKYLNINISKNVNFPQISHFSDFVVLQNDFMPDMKVLQQLSSRNII